jgi:cold shock CspA family protein
MTASLQSQSSHVSNLTVGDTVRFHYALSNIDGKLYTGRVIGPVKHSELWGDVVLIEPFACDYHLPPRHVSLSRIVSIVATAAPVIDEAPVEDVLVTLANISAAYMAWETSWLANAKSAETSRLSAEHDRLLDAYMQSIGVPAKASKPVPTSDETPPAQTVGRVATETRKTGVVASFNPTKGYGYIKSDDGADLYFQARNLQVLGMPISARDRVTFEIMPNMSIEGGADKATRIMIEGFTPAPRASYTAPQERVTEARHAAQHTANARRSLRTQKAAQNAANAASIARVIGKAD